MYLKYVMIFKNTGISKGRLKKTIHKTYKMDTKKHALLLFALVFLLFSCGEETAVEVSDANGKAESELVEKAVDVAKNDKEENLAEETPKAQNLELIEIFVEDPDEIKESTPEPKARYASVNSDELPKAYDNEKTEKEKPKKKTSKPKKKRAKAAIEFEKVSYNFGTIAPGDVIEHKFNFTNTGKGELVIKDAKATCGCTMPSYPFIPIAPGETGTIGVVFNSTGKLGKQKPIVTLTTNIGTKKIYLEGYVFPKERAEDKKETTEEKKDVVPENKETENMEN